MNEARLSSVLSDFARTLTRDFPIQAILDHLVVRIVEVLPVSSAGVTLISAGEAPHYVASSDPAGLRFEQLQSDLDEGPCLTAFASGHVVSVPDLRVGEDWSRFAPAAVASGLRAVFAFPIGHGTGRLGALDLYRDTPGGLDPEDLAAAKTLADVAGAYLFNAQAREDARATTERVQHDALHDPLTGLANRLLLGERIEHAALRANRSNSNAAIVFADLDRFKEVNDRYGHQAGDALLQAVAQRLSGLVRPGDTLARVSGDEFVFLCEDINDADDVDGLARRIDNAFARPFHALDLELSITASVGIAFSGPGETISEQLMVEADRAMYEAKRDGGAGHRIIDLRFRVRRSERNGMANDLRRAFEDEMLRLAYQPIVRTVDGWVTGVEALLRWEDPERGSVPTAAAIRVAEQSDLIDEIGFWVLRQACFDRDRWLLERPDVPLDLSVNLSSLQLLRPGFGAGVEKVLAETEMDPNGLIFDMTEKVLMDDAERVVGVLHELAGHGIRFAMDDFGTGYSSLSFLRKVPIHMVKIDPSFVTEIHRDIRLRAVARAVVELGHLLGLRVVAEGVETKAQRDEVDQIGCDAAQGHYYAMPMSADAISARLALDPAGSFVLPLVGDGSGSLRA